MPFSLRLQIADILNILEFMKKNYLMAVCLFLTVMSGCGNKEQAPQQAEPVKVKVMTVVSSVRNETVRFSGTVQEENGSSLSFPLMGRVKSVKVDLGSRVRQGQLLATLDEPAATCSVLPPTSSRPDFLFHAILSYVGRYLLPASKQPLRPDTYSASKPHPV